MTPRQASWHTESELWLQYSYLFKIIYMVSFFPYHLCSHVTAMMEIRTISMVLEVLENNTQVQFNFTRHLHRFWSFPVFSDYFLNIVTPNKMHHDDSSIFKCMTIPEILGLRWSWKGLSIQQASICCLIRTQVSCHWVKLWEELFFTFLPSWLLENMVHGFWKTTTTKTELMGLIRATVCE